MSSSDHSSQSTSLVEPPLNERDQSNTQASLIQEVINALPDEFENLAVMLTSPDEEVFIQGMEIAYTLIRETLIDCCLKYSQLDQTGELTLIDPHQQHPRKRPSAQKQSSAQEDDEHKSAKIGRAHV